MVAVTAVASGLLVLLVLSVAMAQAADADPGDRVEARDSYLNAYADSHVNKKTREAPYPPPFEQYGPPGPPGPTGHYGPPGGQYGPPLSYGPPPHPVYGPPQHSYPGPDSFSVPHSLIGGLFDKLHVKLDVFTVLKILLKLVIFKKVVSFIAILCLLLFIPKFKHNDKEDEEDSRSFRSTSSLADDRINNLTRYVLGGIEKYSKNDENCDNMQCSAKKVFHDVNEKYPYQRLAKSYLLEEVSS